MDLVERTFWWPTLRRDVYEFVTSCDSCQRSKARRGKTPGTLCSLPVPTEPFESVTADFVTGLKRTKRAFDSILVFVDRLTKYVHIAATKTSCTAPQFARLFFEHVVQHHGVPANLVTDRGPQFAGHFMPEFTRLLGTQSRLSTAFHPQTDGQTERMNAAIEDMLRAFVSTVPDDWDLLLPAAAFAINNAKSATTGQSPFFLNYGRHPHTPFTRELASAHGLGTPAASDLATAISAALVKAKQSMEAAQQRQKFYYDRNKTEMSLAVGQHVMLSAKNLARGSGSKLCAKWVGPFEITRCVGKNAVELKLPLSMQVHPVFHVSLVKRYVRPAESFAIVRDGKMTASQPDAPPVPVMLENTFTSRVKEILTHRLCADEQRKNVILPRSEKCGKRRRSPLRRDCEFLVSWHGLDAAHNSWVDESTVPLQMLSDYWRAHTDT